MAQDQTPFSGTSESQYDLTTYTGRVRHMFTILNAGLLLKSDQEVHDAVALLDAFKRGEVDGKERAADLWASLALKDSAVHPDTGEIIPRLLRFNSFAPTNVFICSIMLMPATIASVPGTIGVHFANQSYNAAINYANRNASNPTPMSQLLQSYAGAVVASVGMALGATYLAKRGQMNTAVRATLPFAAVTSASVINLVSMRRGELTKGIDVFDDEGTSHGSSVIAGQEAIKKCSITRVLWNTAVMLFPPLVLGAITPRIPGARLKTIAEVGVVGGSVFVGVPPSIAVFRRVDSAKAEHLEERFRDLRTKDGTPITTLYFNKGI